MQALLPINPATNLAQLSHSFDELGPAQLQLVEFIIITISDLICNALLPKLTSTLRIQVQCLGVSGNYFYPGMTFITDNINDNFLHNRSIYNLDMMKWTIQYVLPSSHRLKGCNTPVGFSTMKI